MITLILPTWFFWLITIWVCLAVINEILEALRRTLAWYSDQLKKKANQ